MSVGGFGVLGPLGRRYAAGGVLQPHRGHHDGGHGRESGEEEKPDHRRAGRVGDHALGVGAHEAAEVADGVDRGDGGAIQVKGHDELLVYRARCCNPIRGEDIVGYITRGKGVAVHSRVCPNVQSLMHDAERKIEVEWARNTSDSFPVRIVPRELLGRRG